VSCDDWLVVSVFLVAGILVAVKVDECSHEQPADVITSDFGVE
jgi:hypothetical protein